MNKVRSSSSQVGESLLLRDKVDWSKLVARAEPKTRAEMLNLYEFIMGCRAVEGANEPSEQIASLDIEAHEEPTT